MRRTLGRQAWIRVAFAGTLVLTSVFVLRTPARAETDPLCGPFERVALLDERDEIREPGVTSPNPAGPGAEDAGSIVRLPAPLPASDADRSGRESEALLALPKNEAGAIPTNFELGPGAKISESFFSPVICATLARVTGPAGATLEQLVTVVPSGSVVVPNDVYSSAADQIRKAEEPPAGEAMLAPRPDPYAPLQYGLAISGVRSARDLSSGEGVKIALLDSAPEIEHRDLSGTRIRPLSADGSESETPQTGVHGTLMAGVIAAVEGNGFGIMGLAPKAELISIPICKPVGTAGGTCTIFDLLQGLDRAWDAEAQLVNLSLAGPANPLLERGVARLEDLGVVVVAAAGNEGTTQKRYPAAYPSVVGVGAVDDQGLRFTASNRGDWVELFAPGVEVLSTVPGSAFAFGSGTSLAAAHVTGSLAILTAAVGDPKIARAELFRAAQANLVGGARSLPNVCDVFARLELDCSIGGKGPRL